MELLVNYVGSSNKISLWTGISRPVVGGSLVSVKQLGNWLINSCLWLSVNASCSQIFKINKFGCSWMNFTLCIPNIIIFLVSPFKKWSFIKKKKCGDIDQKLVSGVRQPWFNPGFHHSVTVSYGNHSIFLRIFPHLLNENNENTWGLRIFTYSVCHIVHVKYS